MPSSLFNARAEENTSGGASADTARGGSRRKSATAERLTRKTASNALEALPFLRAEEARVSSTLSVVYV
jgi:hypothetical protein